MRRDKKGESLGHRKSGKKNERLHMTLTNPSRRHPTWLKEEKVHRRQPESECTYTCAASAVAQTEQEDLGLSLPLLHGRSPAVHTEGEDCLFKWLCMATTCKLLR